jgi:hypothetical protein
LIWALNLLELDGLLANRAPRRRRHARLLLREPRPVQITFHEAPLLGHAIEVHPNTDVMKGMFAVIAADAEGWDGSDPLREFPEP